MITGDINFAQTDCSNLISSDKDEQTFLDALAELHFEQMITGKEKVQLDLILCNHLDLITLVKKHNRLTSLYKTDHPPHQAKPFNPYCYINFDLKTELWYTWLLNKIEKHIPRKTKHRSSLVPWVTSETSNLIKIMDPMRRKCEKNVTGCHLDKLKTFEKHLEFNLSEDQRVYEENLFVDGNFSKSQKYFKSIRKTDTIPGEVYLDDQSASSIIAKTNLFNKYFQSVFSHSLYVGENNFSHECKKANFHFTATETEKILENLDINKAKGPDNLGNIFLKKLSCSISKSLYLLF